MVTALLEKPNEPKCVNIRNIYLRLEVKNEWFTIGYFSVLKFTPGINIDFKR
jgi:hypothetical protein